TILDALVKPFTQEYLARASQKLHAGVGDVPFLIMQSNGGVVSAREVRRAPITTLLSGPAAGVLGASFVAELAGFRDLLTRDAGAGRAGIAALGARLGLGLEETAAGVLEIAAWNQAHGIRQVTVQRGRDPSDYCLVTFGGSGGLFAGEVADVLGIRTVLVPRDPGNLSAFGLQASDIRRDYVRTLVRSERMADVGELEATWEELESRG